MALIGDKQWLNEDGMLKMEMTFMISSVGMSGSAGMVVFLDGECGDYYYVGIWAEFDTLFFGKFVDDEWTLIADVTLEERGMTAFDFNAHYSLQV